MNIIKNSITVTKESGRVEMDAVGTFRDCWVTNLPWTHRRMVAPFKDV